jgi:leucyl/phenylalanyl-tRNA--protein transferase|tara:strand:+ start:114673 stop:115314 length:642 start_codon:yes stop_codon:yes gene_type:complete
LHLLTEKIWFPPVTDADEDGLLAVGGDLSSERLLLAYQSGIFPWYSEGQPILWWSPNPRMVLFPKELRVSKSFRKTINSEKFRVTFNTSFPEVIKNCAAIKRDGQAGTWITSEMERAYIGLHEKGYAFSVEVWQENELTGGLYGIDLADQKVFCGESMFTKVSDASKVGLYHLVELLKEKNYKLIDCQIYTEHLERLGAKEISRDEFLQHISC